MSVLFRDRLAPQPWHHSHSRPQPGQNSNSWPLDENDLQFSSLFTLIGLARDTCGSLTPEDNELNNKLVNNSHTKLNPKNVVTMAIAVAGLWIFLPASPPH